MTELARILPPDDWLTRDERRLWLRRTAAYLAAGVARPAAEHEAMAELVMTGKLCDPNERLLDFLSTRWVDFRDAQEIQQAE